MGRYTTKEDDVDRISTSVYVTNFPDNVSAKELFLACKQYGHVVDSYIPVKKSKYGKRFGFVKFINVFSEERLVNNLCTVWIGRVRLHANIARFQRPNGKNIGEGNKKPNVTPTPSVKPNLSGSLGNEKSYRGVLNGDTKTKLVGKISEPSIVLGDECVMSMNVDNALFGRVKVFASLANLKMALGNEGFSDIVIKYMGEQWVMLEFKSLESMEKFKKCVSVMSWFSQVIKATNEFEVDGRIAWVEVEGVPFKLWTNNTFTRIAEKWGKLLDVDDQDETCFHSKRLCVYLKAGNSIREDFKITHRGKMYWIRANETQGWVPEFTDEYESEDDNSMDEEGEVKKNGIKDEHSDGEIVPESLFEDGELENNHVDGIFSKKEKEVSEDPFNLYSLLKRQNKLDDKDTNSEDSLKHPPGFTPLTHNCENDTSEKKVDQNDEFRATWLLIPIVEIVWDSKWKGVIAGFGRTHWITRRERRRAWNEELVIPRLAILVKSKRIVFGIEGTGSKAKIKWAVEGDENSVFFMISHEQSDHMEREVSNDEIKKSVWECGTDKAPGPDGFTFGFFRHFWHLVDRDVCEAVRQVGFGEKWRKWIQCCLHSLKGSIIINGSPTDEFQFGKGLKQGDPLSPFLFLLIMESLHISFQRVVDAGMFHGIDVGGLVNLSHMFYADDAVFIGVIQIWNLFRSKFFNGHESSGKKASWVQWKKALAPKDNGGLGYYTEPMEKVDEISGIGANHTSRGGLELTQVEELAKVINPVVLTQSPDSWSWTLNNSGGYTVASSRNMIDSRLLPKGDLKTRWIRYVPNKVNTFAWKIQNEKLVTSIGFKIDITLNEGFCFHESTRNPCSLRDHGLEVMETLRKSPSTAVRVILIRMKQKQEEWIKCREDFNKVWADIYAKNHYKSLDHRSFYFKQQDSKDLSTKCNGEFNIKKQGNEQKDDVFSIVLLLEVCSTKEQVNQVLKLWTTFLEPMLYVPSRPENSDNVEDVEISTRGATRNEGESDGSPRADSVTFNNVKQGKPACNGDDNVSPKRVDSSKVIMVNGGTLPKEDGSRVKKDVKNTVIRGKAPAVSVVNDNVLPRSSMELSGRDATPRPRNVHNDGHEAKSNIDDVPSSQQGDTSRTLPVANGNFAKFEKEEGELSPNVYFDKVDLAAYVSQWEDHEDGDREDLDDHIFLSAKPLAKRVASSLHDGGKKHCNVFYGNESLHAFLAPPTPQTLSLWKYLLIGIVMIDDYGCLLWLESEKDIRLGYCKAVEIEILDVFQLLTANRKVDKANLAFPLDNSPLHHKNPINKLLISFSTAFGSRNTVYQYTSTLVLIPRFLNAQSLRFLELGCVYSDDELETFLFDMKFDPKLAQLNGIARLTSKLVKKKKHIIYPLVYRLIKLVLVLPISAMKIVKTRLRNKIRDEWMNDCLVTYIEKEIALLSLRGPGNSMKNSIVDAKSWYEEGEVKKNGIKNEHSDGEIVPESLFEDGELENNHVDGIFSKKEKEVLEDPFNLYSLLKRQNNWLDKDTNSG
ncbi:nucleotide-binding alpha-beta plait domain-containing protein [Tanacetum coccineum]